MRLRRKFEIILLFVALVFSWWLMSKSFRYDATNHQFLIGRNEVGDFGLHLGLIRSFSWGDNMPAESPFYAGRPLPYHYFFDLTAGLLERAGVRMDIAVNGLSALAFTVVLVLIYKLSQVIFGKSKLLGLTSVLLFIFPSSVTFIDFLRDKPISQVLLKSIWRLPDYIHKGPFDGSLVSIYFTPAVYLNQRHLIFGMAVGLFIIYRVLGKILMNQKISSNNLIALGLILGLSSRIHSLLFVATLTELISLLIFFKKYRWIIFITIPALLVTFLLYHDILGQGRSLLERNFFNPGFLSSRPLTLINFMTYWWANLWLASILTPVAFFISNSKQRKIFLSFFTLFVVANLFQLSFRIEHNHSFINYFFLVTSSFVAYVLTSVWKKRFLGKIIYLILLLLLIASGILNLMAVKNDYLYPVSDAPTNHFIEWIKNKTDKHAIFLAGQDLYDPVVLSGRKNYFGATYYLLVMGYDFAKRQQLVKTYFETTDTRTFTLMRAEGISYIVIPIKPVNDFPYSVNRIFFERQLRLDYSDENVEVYRL